MMTDRRTWVLRLLASAVIGVVTGLVVLALEHSVDDILKELFEAPVWVPGGGRGRRSDRDGDRDPVPERGRDGDH